MPSARAAFFMSANKESLLIKFKNQIDENIKKGAKTSKDLRIGIPSKFIASDGKEYRLQNVGRYFRTGKNPTFLDVALNKEVSAARANALKIQTSPDVEKWNPKTDAVKGTEAHHKRMVKMYAPFYEGLNEKQARELTKWFVDEGVPLGDAKSNLKNLSPNMSGITIEPIPEPFMTLAIILIGDQLSTTSLLMRQLKSLTLQF